MAEPNPTAVGARATQSTQNTFAAPPTTPTEVGFGDSIDGVTRRRCSLRAICARKALMSKQTKKTTAKKTINQRVLDETTAALAIAEYLALENVKPAELDYVTGEGKYASGAASRRSATPREIALTFRVAEILGIADLFAMPPRYRMAFARAREYIQILSGVATKLKQADAAEARA